MPIRNSVTRAQLEAMTTGFRTIFANVFGASKPTWQLLAEHVPSNTLIETYTWLNQIPGMREWIDERFIKRLEQEAYTLTNKDFEATIAIARNHLADDQLGTYTMAVKGLAAAAAEHPDELVFDAVKKGHETKCYDGQNFFDTEHLVRVDGKDTSVSNFTAGAGDKWYLLATNKPIMPFIYQDRQKPDLVSIDDPKAEHVFMNKEFIYGADSRGAAGYTFWQLAHASGQELTKETFEAARTAMIKQKGDEGRSLNIVPNMILVPPSLETAAEEILVVDRLDNGKTNPNKGKAKILMSPWLS